MTVTVLTCPVTVSRDVTGVGVHVDVGDEVVKVVWALLERIVAEGTVVDAVSVADCRNC